MFHCKMVKCMNYYRGQTNSLYSNIVHEVSCDHAATASSMLNFDYD